MIFNKIKDLKKLFRKKPPTKFWQFFMKSIVSFLQLFYTYGEMNFSEMKGFFRTKLSRFCRSFFTKKFFQICDFFENHKTIHFPHITRYCYKKCYKAGKKFRGTCWKWLSLTWVHNASLYYSCLQGSDEKCFFFSY